MNKKEDQNTEDYGRRRLLESPLGQLTDYQITKYLRIDPSEASTNAPNET